MIQIAKQARVIGLNRPQTVAYMHDVLTFKRRLGPASDHPKAKGERFLIRHLLHSVLSSSLHGTTLYDAINAITCRKRSRYILFLASVSYSKAVSPEVR